MRGVSESGRRGAWDQEWKIRGGGAAHELPQRVRPIQTSHQKEKSELERISLLPKTGIFPSSVPTWMQFSASTLLSPRCSSCRPTLKYELVGTVRSWVGNIGGKKQLETWEPRDNRVKGLLPTRAKALPPSSAFSLSLPTCLSQGAAVFVFEKRPPVPLVRLYPLWWLLPVPENSDQNGKWSPVKQKEEGKLCSGKNTSELTEMC